MEGSQSLGARRILQEYWSLVYEAKHADDARSRKVKLLRAWAVVHYALNGPTNCEQCQAPVRLAIPVTCERMNGESLRYACLCTNCTFGELERAQRIIMQVGSARVEYSHEGILSA
jgi:hypothetical protein